MSVFQCSSASRKFLNAGIAGIAGTGRMFQCSSASRKFLNPAPSGPGDAVEPVSVLFSEPKIPQFTSSSETCNQPDAFQCSSASRKFLNPDTASASADDRPGFSALQRAENSSIMRRRDVGAGRVRFQCSSASRKFLNQCRRSVSRWLFVVSVLFSEPKIPQYCDAWTLRGLHRRFSALQRAENSSIERPQHQRGSIVSFSALQRAENSSIRIVVVAWGVSRTVSVLFSEPKIPQ